MLQVDQVTVGEDRAVVVRRGSVSVEAGSHVVRIDAVSPVIVDKSLQVRVDGGTAKVASAVVQRELTAVLGDQSEVERLRTECDKLADDILVREMDEKRLRSELSMIEAIATQTLKELGSDTAHGKPLDGASGQVHLVEEREAARRVTLDETHEALERMREDLVRLQQRIAVLQSPATRARCAIEITLIATQAEQVSLSVEYVVPNACWRPSHTASLDGSTVEITTHGTVWQNTGEDWTNVTVRLSTERPSLGRNPPSLSDDMLTVQRRAEVVEVEMRDVEPEHTGLGRSKSSRVPGIDDGGEVRILEARARAAIPSDGRPHRVIVDSYTSPAMVDSVCYPALAAAVVVRSRQTHNSSRPLLAGPVDLVRAGGFVGRSTLSFLSPGEDFELGWGPDPGVRVRRQEEQVDEDPSLWSGWIARKHRVRVHFGVIDGGSRTVNVTERIPVSEVEKVQVVQEEAETTDKARANQDGFVRWQLELGPSARKTMTLAWVVKRHRDVRG